MKTNKKIHPHYRNVYGTWRVTTEGDCEGRTVKQLGTYVGYVDEIALHLADQACYELRFTKIKKQPIQLKPTANEVMVSFNIDSNTWDMAPNGERIEEVSKIFKDRPVVIEHQPSFAGFLIKKKKP